MTQENQVFVANEVTNLTQETVASSVINRPTCAVAKLSTIVKIHKYRKSFKRGTILFQWPWRCIMHLGMIRIVSSRNVLVFSAIDDQEVVYPLFLHSIFQTTCQYCSSASLASEIEKKIVLGSDACSKPPNTIRSHDLHVDDIKEVVGEIASYHERDQLSPSFWALWAMCLLTFPWPPPFCLPGMVLIIIFIFVSCVGILFLIISTTTNFFLQNQVKDKLMSFDLSMQPKIEFFRYQI